MPHFQGVLVRRQDGLAKQWQQLSKLSPGRYGKSNMKFTSVYSIPALDGSTERLVVCEKENVDVHETEPFTRILPGILRHCLFFGDLLFIVEFGNGSCGNFTLADMTKIFEGEHPKWSVRGIRDISQQTETFVEEPSDDDGEDDKSDDDPEEESEDDIDIQDDENDDDDDHHPDDDDED